MKILESYNLFLEKKALYPSQYRKYVKKFKRNRYEKLFKGMKEKYEGDRNAYRIYLPLVQVENDKSTVNDNYREEQSTFDQIKDYLSDREYEIVDYRAGKCKHEGAKNPSRIGQVLTRLSNQEEEQENKEYALELLKKFNEDVSRKYDELMVCISRHPYDIAGADTGRKWTNCMTIGAKFTPQIRKLLKEHRELTLKLRETQIEKVKADDIENKEERKKIKLELKDKILKLKQVRNDINEKIRRRREDGCNIEYLIEDVKRGSLEAFLIKKTDKNITDPIADMNIKPYISTSNPKDKLLVADKNYYGEGTESFRKTVQNWCDEVNGKKTGIYELDEKLYDDSEYGYILKISTAQEFIDWADNKNFSEDDLHRENYDIDIFEFTDLIKNQLNEEEFGKVVEYLIDKNLYDLDEYISERNLDNKEIIDLLLRFKRVGDIMDNGHFEEIFDEGDTESVIKVLNALKKKLHYTSTSMTGYDFDVEIKYQDGRNFNRDISEMDKELYDKDFVRFPNKKSEKEFLRLVKENVPEVKKEDKTLQLAQECPDCKGSGFNENEEICETCEGEGTVKNE